MTDPRDIVDRLRVKPTVWEEAREAADEIVRLRIALKKANVINHFYRKLTLKRNRGDL